MARHVVYLMSLAIVFTVPAAADEPKTPEEEKPQWQRMLHGDDARKAADLQERIIAAEQADRYGEAIRLHEELLALRTKVQGADHWETVNRNAELHRARSVAALSTEGRANWRKSLEDHDEAKQLEAKNQYAKAQPLWEQCRCSCEHIFGEKDVQTATIYNNLAVNLNAQGNPVAAQTLFRTVLDLRLELLGKKHPATALSYRHLALSLDAEGKYTDAQPLFERALNIRREVLGERHAGTATAYSDLALNLIHIGKYAEAESLLRTALNLRLALFGVKHPETAVSYNNLGLNLNYLGKHADAEGMYRNALDARRELLGEKHPDTANSYNNLAASMNAQGMYADAQALHRKALRLRRELFGEKHRDVAQSYAGVAGCLYGQGKYADAQPLLQKALDLRRELLGEKHPDTAVSYNNLAVNLIALGKYSEAQTLNENALRLRLELLGEKHPDTTVSYNNLAANLDNQGKYAEAESLYRKALELSVELLGEKHPDTALSYNNLATNLDAQGKYADAQPLLKKALDLHLELFGEKPRLTALSYANLAVNLAAQGKYAAAQPLYQKALELVRELLGEKHPATAQSYNNLAFNLTGQGKYADAQPLLVKAATSYEAARLAVANGGLDRAAFGADRSPYRLQTATEARLGHDSAAWTAAEADLARGLSDETASRHGVVVTPAEQNRQAAVDARLNQLQPLILQLVTKQATTDEEKDELGELQDERRALESELAELAVALSQRELATLGQVQPAIPADAALVLWVDVNDWAGKLQEHWGCVGRGSGDPIWERLPGTGPEGKWTDDDSALPQELREAVAGGASSAKCADLARKLYAQRIAPLEKHLAGVTRLFVVPVNAMAVVPVEVLTDKFTISYVPSGTFLARLKDRPASSAGSLLALGDPVFPPIEPPKDLPLPPGGLLITQVLPSGNAAQARLQPGDVLLKYAGSELTAVEQLGKLVQVHAQDKSVPIGIWRDGETADRDLAPGKLGVVLDRQPAPEAIAGKRKADVMLAALARGGDWNELPGSAVEVARLTKLMGDQQATTLTRSAASEQELEQLRAAGNLAGFRYLHFATHGEPNNARSFESALILAQDHVSREIPLGGGKYYDGRLTANEVLETWNLNADLVTLSACESALGRSGGGDGVLGFAQAFLLAGSRAVCLSLWKVDDTATALLMDRFYQNLLGKRPGLAKPMPKAAALAEAKRWLRGLSVDEAANLAADMTSGVARGKGEPALKLVLPAAEPQAAAKDENHPFSHPRYWAAFILIGDPD